MLGFNPLGYTPLSGGGLSSETVGELILALDGVGISITTSMKILGVLSPTLTDSTLAGDTNLVSNGTLSSQLDSGTVSISSKQKLVSNLDVTQEDLTNTATSNLNQVGGIDVDLTDLMLRAALEGAIGALPVTDLMYFSNHVSGRLSEALMEVYNRIVDGLPYGAMRLIDEGIESNQLNGRFLWQLEFSDGTKIAEANHAAFTYSFALAVSEGKRLPGSDDIQRENYLLLSMPLVFNPTWRVPFTV